MDLSKIIGRTDSLFKEDLKNNSQKLLSIVSQSRFLVIGGAGSIGQAVAKEIFRIGVNLPSMKTTLKGNVDADVVTVSGKCDGQVSGDVISVKSTGKISGEVFYENISIEEGAIIEAQIGKRKSKN